MTERLELKYSYVSPMEGSGRHHVWSVVGPLGGVHIWAAKASDQLYDGGFYGGVELHYRKDQGEWYGHNEQCWLLDAPCWYTGTSSGFSNNIAPYLKPFADGEIFPSGIHEMVKAELHYWYKSMEKDDDK